MLHCAISVLIIQFQKKTKITVPNIREKWRKAVVQVSLNKKAEQKAQLENETIEEKVKRFEDRLEIVEQVLENFLGVPLIKSQEVIPAFASATMDIKKKYGKFDNVLLTDKERQELDQELGSQRASECIENLSAYIASKRKKYRSHYATIINWERRRKESGAKSGTRGLPESYTASPEID